MAREQLLDVVAGVPDLERALLGEPAHRLAIGAHAVAHRSAPDPGGKPRSRPATSMLAANRLTSHSNGPGCVSSKSLRSNTSRRSGPAKVPKLLRCASPHSCAVRPVEGTAGQVGGHDRRAAAVERERRAQHAAVADRDQPGDRASRPGARGSPPGPRGRARGSSRRGRSGGARAAPRGPPPRARRRATGGRLARSLRGARLDASGELPGHLARAAREDQHRAGGAAGDPARDAPEHDRLLGHRGRVSPSRAGRHGGRR